jgi:hypothetical protein
VHGLIHTELERFARARAGDAVWEAALTEAGLEGRTWRPDERYDDTEALELVVALSKVTGIGPQSLLAEFGEALAEPLIARYGSLVDPQWRTLDLVQNTEDLIHQALRRQDAAARPPLLRTVRRGPDEILVIYASERRMCGVAKGLVRGIAAHYGERVQVDEESCMLAGDSTCSIAVTRV